MPKDSSEELLAHLPNLPFSRDRKTGALHEIHEEGNDRQTDEIEGVLGRIVPPFFVRPHVDGIDGVAENQRKQRHDGPGPHSSEAANAHEKNVIAIGEVEEHLHRDGWQGLVGFFVRAAAGGSGGASFLLLALLEGGD